MALQVVVLCDQTTFGSSWAHLPRGRSVMFFLIPVNIFPFALSSAPLDYGWYTEEKWILVPMLKQNCLKSSL